MSALGARYYGFLSSASMGDNFASSHLRCGHSEISWIKGIFSASFAEIIPLFTAFSAEKALLFTAR